MAAVVAAFDETSLLDFLDIDMAELVNILEEIIDERKEDLRAAIGVW